MLIVRWMAEVAKGKSGRPRQPKLNTIQSFCSAIRCARGRLWRRQGSRWSTSRRQSSCPTRGFRAGVCVFHVFPLRSWYNMLHLFRSMHQKHCSLWLLLTVSSSPLHFCFTGVCATESSTCAFYEFLGAMRWSSRFVWWSRRVSVTESVCPLSVCVCACERYIYIYIYILYMYILNIYICIY